MKAPSVQLSVVVGWPPPVAALIPLELAEFEPHSAALETMARCLKEIDRVKRVPLLIVAFKLYYHEMSSDEREQHLTKPPLNRVIELEHFVVFVYRILFSRFPLAFLYRFGGTGVQLMYMLLVAEHAVLHLLYSRFWHKIKDVSEVNKGKKELTMDIKKLFDGESKGRNRTATPKQNGLIANGQSTDSKKKITASDDVLKGLVEWLCIQLKKPSHPTRSILASVHCLATLLKEHVARSSSRLRFYMML
ncbi:hypothetical protein L2E82_18798 [Cichorium intybus]|uniref:Uncharacterized protein n=1 Tax=Cichorium intybus TaxID=13427 RepID=A0ACB9FBA7_CICIN|nr:hypothetical protein L2E82_18798 [Cichorium intybus]